MIHQAAFARMRRIRSIALCVMLLATLLAPLSACGEQAGKTVRVGWYDSSFNSMDSSGRRSGYAYEYQLKIAAYTGWRYEYVTGSWSELLQMLKSGKIDLLSDVSHTPQRESWMLFPALPMGTEEYYIFISPDNTEITSADYSTFNGKKIGVNKGSVQVGYFVDWARRHDIHAELIEVMCTEAESLEMLESGALDAYVTVDSFLEPQLAVAVCKVGASDFFFAVNRNRPDLLAELEGAMSRIQDENRYYNQWMFEKYFRGAGANVFLSAEETQWLSGHGPIRVGYQDNYLAFCASDKATGALTGALKDWLESASGCIANAQLGFETTVFPTATAALDALTRGEVDCMFPANLSPFDAESLDVIMTPPLMDTDICAVVRLNDQKPIANRGHVVVAVNEGNTNYDAFLLEHFPGWQKLYYPNTEICLKAVADGKADCVLISTYRYNNISRLCDKYRLTTISTGVQMDYCFAVANGNTTLYTILAKAIGLVPDSAVNTALSYYITEDAKLTFGDFIVDNLGAVAAVIGAMVLLILALMVKSMRAERRARALISATELDALTGLYNRDFFYQYANRRYREQPGLPMDAIALNIEQFHTVNAIHGREFGDQVLRALGNEVHEIAIAAGGIAGRFEADRFGIYGRHMEEYQTIYRRLQRRMDNLASNASIRLRMGVMPWQPKLEPEQLFDMARTACTMARGHYKQHLIVFDDEVREREMFQQRLLNDLRRALDSREFMVFYQPKFDIQTEPPKLVSAEALVRWQHPELGTIPPDDFIPLLEKNGRIGLVDKYVWAEAAGQIARWRDRYGVTLPVSVNLSRVDVFDPTLEHTLDGILLSNGLGREAIKLEVTESAYTENADQVIQVVEGLRKKGYEVEMDDFGTGYSSLNMLSAMPVDVLKMDRAFIRNIEHNEKDVQFVALILGIAKNLQIPVVAEGVETEAQMKLLKQLGCALVQGYYFSQPLSAPDFEETFVRSLPRDAREP